MVAFTLPLLVGLLLFLQCAAATTTRPPVPTPAVGINSFREAPVFRNGEACSSVSRIATIHVAMTLDFNYLRGTMAAVFSILQHSICPEDIIFHFVWAEDDAYVYSSIRATFPYLRFKAYHFDVSCVRGLISKSIRSALDQPLNYARIYLADILPQEVHRVIYLDSDLVMVDDIAQLWEVDLKDKVLAAPEYCHANLTNYFTSAFWSDPELSRAFEGRKPCYFNTGDGD